MSGAATLSHDLTDALQSFASAGPVIIALDYDGVLAPIVTDRDQARPSSASMDAVGQLHAVDDVQVALVSGRSLSDLRRLAQPPAGLVLFASHGAEVSGVDLALSADQVALRHRIVETLSDAVRDFPQCEVEVKPIGAVLHTRRADRQDALGATAAARAALADLPGVHIQGGKEVLDVRVTSTTKGDALNTLRTANQRVLFIGDDVTDEDGFAVLNDEIGDVSIKVGDGTTKAMFRIDDTDQVTTVLTTLLPLLQNR